MALRRNRPTLGGEQAEEFLLALPQHGSGDFGVRAHHMMFDRDAFVFTDPRGRTRPRHKFKTCRSLSF